MWKKITSLPLRAYFGITEFVQDFKKDERGLSGVVVAVLLILVAVLAVVLIWGLLEGWLGELWEKIIGEGDKIG